MDVSEESHSVCHEPECDLISDCDEYGPPLPPHMLRKDGDSDESAPSWPHCVLSNKNKEANRKGNNSTGEYGPTLQPRFVHKGGSYNSNTTHGGHHPPLLPRIQKNTSENSSCSVDSDGKYGQSLQPLTVNENKCSDDEEEYGPALPPQMINKRKTDYQSDSVPVRKKLVGPELPPGFSGIIASVLEAPSAAHNSDSSKESGSEPEDAIGPKLPVELYDEEDYRIRQIEARAQRMKDKLSGKPDVEKPLVRESWMTELPDDRPNLLGLTGARHFSRRINEKGDRSVWTDTPADKERKAKRELQKEKKEDTPQMMAEKFQDEKLTEYVEKYNKDKRGKSLVELHKEKVKKKPQDGGQKQRRPFSREEDLKVNRFDEAQKATIMKKASKLNSRFAAGNRKFL